LWQAFWAVWGGVVLAGIWEAFANPYAHIGDGRGIVDTDGDGLTDIDEVLFEAIHAPDTDGDGLRDGDEQRAGTNPVAIDRMATRYLTARRCCFTPARSILIPTVMG
jgi:hypothetical protein